MKFVHFTGVFEIKLSTIKLNLFGKQNENSYTSGKLMQKTFSNNCKTFFEYFFLKINNFRECRNLWRKLQRETLFIVLSFS